MQYRCSKSSMAIIKQNTHSTAVCVCVCVYVCVLRVCGAYLCAFCTHVFDFTCRKGHGGVSHIRVYVYYTIINTSRNIMISTHTCQQQTEWLEHIPISGFLSYQLKIDVFHHTVHPESISLFQLVVKLQPYSKMDSISFFSSKFHIQYRNNVKKGGAL